MLGILSEMEVGIPQLPGSEDQQREVDVQHIRLPVGKGVPNIAQQSKENG